MIKPVGYGWNNPAWQVNLDATHAVLYSMLDPLNNIYDSPFSHNSVLGGSGLYMFQNSQVRSITFHSIDMRSHYATVFSRQA